MTEFFEFIAIESKVEVDKARLTKHRVNRRVTAKRRTSKW